MAQPPGTRWFREGFHPKSRVHVTVRRTTDHLPSDIAIPIRPEMMEISDLYDQIAFESIEKRNAFSQKHFWSLTGAVYPIDFNGLPTRCSSNLRTKSS
jgi:hypothetical protein